MLLVTPVMLFKALNPLAEKLAEGDPDSLISTLGKKLMDSLTPLLIALVNIAIVPVLVDIVAALAYKETKSSFVKISLHLNLFYMALNIVFLPLTG